MNSNHSSNKPKAVLVGLKYPTLSNEDYKSSMAELGRLANTLGFDVIATLSQKRAYPSSATVIGGGKLKELAKLTGGNGVVLTHKAPVQKKDKPSEEDEEEIEDLEEDDEDLSSIKEKATIVIFDEELTPTQLRNLESATGVEILDRNGVIIEIFHRHAKTRQAKLQVEIARLKYQAPRLRMSRVGQDREGGGGLGSSGESALELDRRRIRDRISELTHELEDINENQITRSQRRKDQLKVALVGYTNAGKSSLMRALTETDVYVEDKLFATLDTTIRALQPETHPRILISDTVGFIKKLPHDLVASFRSTLNEASDASLLLFVVDSSDPTFRSQLEVTRTVLKDLNLETSESLLILNKIDRLEPGVLETLHEEFPGSIGLSAKNPKDVSKLRNIIIEHFEKDMVEEDFMVPYSKGKFIGEIHSSMKVIKEVNDDKGTHLRVRAFPETIASMLKKLED